MRRSGSNNSSAVGHDSFLDIVTNMVGILIILVMVVGMRIRNAPTMSVLEPAETVAEELQRELAIERSLRGDVLSTAKQLRSVQAETAVRDKERNMVATAIAVLEREIADRRDKLDGTVRQDIEQRGQVADARKTLEQLRGRQASLATAEAPPVLIENYPTPLAKAVDGPEVHFQLRDGRITLIPVESLLLMAREDMRGKLHDYERHRDLSETANTVGPRDGFRFRYTVQRYEETVRLPQGTGRREGIRMVNWTVIPVSGQLGETIQEALVDGSKFRGALASLRPDQHTVTVWVYDDSFDAFRQLRKELHRLGFPAAARPLPSGVPIAGSIDGSKSVAE